LVAAQNLGEHQPGFVRGDAFPFFGNRKISGSRVGDSALKNWLTYTGGIWFTLSAGSLSVSAKGGNGGSTREVGGIEP